MTKIDIVSGFLGAGKTTLIKKLLSEALKGEQVVLIENEFGEIGVDGGFLKEAGIEITEMNSGCICCSLVGDFATALKEVLQKYHPERILIEPSGVGKLSDVMAAVQNAGLKDAALNSAVAVVDASKAKMYIKNFGEFFINQIEHAGTIILSRTGNISEEKLNKAIELIKEHNSKATIVTTPWEQVEGKAILETIEGAKDLEKELLEEVMKHHAEHEHEHHHHDHEHEHHHDHDHEHEHEHEHGDHCSCGCGHDHGHEGHHHADEVFDSIGFETAKAYSKADIERALTDLEEEDKYGMVLRSKGIVASTDSDEWIHFDYTPGEVNVRYGKADVTGKIVVIGAEIKEEAIKELFA